MAMAKSVKNSVKNNRPGTDPCLVVITQGQLAGLFAVVTDSYNDDRIITPFVESGYILPPCRVPADHLTAVGEGSPYSHVLLIELPEESAPRDLMLKAKEKGLIALEQHMLESSLDMDPEYANSIKFMGSLKELAEFEVSELYGLTPGSSDYKTEVENLITYGVQEEGFFIISEQIKMVLEVVSSGRMESYLKSGAKMILDRLYNKKSRKK
jgi:hypothetical protein